MKFRGTVELDADEFHTIFLASCIFEGRTGLDPREVETVAKVSGEEGPTLTLDLEAVQHLQGALQTLMEGKAKPEALKTEADYTNVKRALALLKVARERMEPCNTSILVDEEGGEVQ